MKLKRGIQKRLRERTGLSAAYINDILSGRVKLTSWPTAKKLASASNTDPILWLEYGSDEIKAAISKTMDMEAA